MLKTSTSIVWLYKLTVKFKHDFNDYLKLCPLEVKWTNPHFVSFEKMAFKVGMLH